MRLRWRQGTGGLTRQRGAALLASLWLLVTLPGLVVAQRVSVLNVRTWSLGDVTRVAVEVSGPFEYKYERLSNPERLYVDVLNAVNRVARGRLVHEVPLHDSIVQRIRVGQNRPDVVRVVLDLNGDCEVSTTRLVNPERLVIEIRPRRKQADLSRLKSLPPLGKAGARSAGEVETKRSSPAPQMGREAPSAEVSADVRAGGEKLRTSSSKDVTGTTPAGEEAAAGGPAPGAASTEATQPIDVARLKDAPSPLPKETRANEGRRQEPDLVPKPAQRNQQGKRSLTRALGLKVQRVVIDPGHGGKDTGTIGPTGLAEKDVALDVARRLARLVEEKLGAEAILTRADDEFVPLEERTRIANQARADLFISLHVNSSRYRSVAGIETFYLSLTDSQADLEVAARENAGATRSIHELTELVRKIALDEKVQESREFATFVQGELYNLARKVSSRSRNRGVKKAPFVVLIGAQMPSILVELGFITNPQEERLLKDPAHRQHIAEAVYRGIEAYAHTLSHFELASRDQEE